jgi:rRNA maturation endonuclease Nob1
MRDRFTKEKKPEAPEEKTQQEAPDEVKINNDEKIRQLEEKIQQLEGKQGLSEATIKKQKEAFEKLIEKLS